MSKEVLYEPLKEMHEKVRKSTLFVLGLALTISKVPQLSHGKRE